MLQPIKEDPKTASGIITRLDHQQDDAPTKKGVVVKLGERVNKKMLKGRRIQTGQTVNYFPEKATLISYCGDPIMLVHIDACSSID